MCSLWATSEFRKFTYLFNSYRSKSKMNSMFYLKCIRNNKSPLDFLKSRLIALKCRHSHKILKNRTNFCSKRTSTSFGQYTQRIVWSLQGRAAGRYSLWGYRTFVRRSRLSTRRFCHSRIGVAPESLRNVSLYQSRVHPRPAIYACRYNRRMPTSSWRDHRSATYGRRYVQAAVSVYVHVRTRARLPDCLSRYGDHSLAARVHRAYATDSRPMVTLSRTASEYSRCTKGHLEHVSEFRRNVRYHGIWWHGGVAQFIWRFRGVRDRSMQSKCCQRVGQRVSG